MVDNQSIEIWSTDLRKIDLWAFKTFESQVMPRPGKAGVVVQHDGGGGGGGRGPGGGHGSTASGRVMVG